MQEAKNTDPRWLYWAGAAAAFIAVIFFRRNLSAELMAFNGFGLFTIPEQTPFCAWNWFALLLADPIVGLVLLNFCDVINYLLVGVLFTALFAALRKAERTLPLVALALAWTGILIFVVSNQALPMLSLSRHYDAASTYAQRAQLIAAGEARLEIDNPGQAIPGVGTLLGLFLVTAAALLFSLGMLRTPVFNKATAWIGLLAGSFQFLYFPLLFLSPDWVTLPFVLSAPFRVTWYILSAIRLLKLNH